MNTEEQQQRAEEEKCLWADFQAERGTEGEGPRVEGTFSHLPKQPLPPPGELGAEGTQDPAVWLSSESQAGAAVSLAGLVPTRHDRYASNPEAKKRPLCGKGMA